MSDAWMLTFSGAEIQFKDFKPTDVCLDDITVSLARKARFNGHTTERVRNIYSVAQHSCLVHDRIEEQFPDSYQMRMAALMHDASEAYLPDMHPHLKTMFPGFKELENTFHGVIAERYGFDRTGDSYRAIKEVDLRMLATERRDLMAFGRREWEMLDDVEPYPEHIRCWSIEEGRNEFLIRFSQCLGLMS